MYKIVRLNFGRSPTHFGETGIGLEETSERVHSDTLFSAWISTYARLFGGEEVEALFKQFLNSEEPPFRLSSTFVYRRAQEGFIDYLPKPIQMPKGYPQTPQEGLAIAKTYKKLHHLPLSIWQRWYQGAGFNTEDRDSLINFAANPDHKTGKLGQSDAFDYAKAFKQYELPKVSIDRTTSATNFYHTGLTQFDWKPSNASSHTDDIQNLAGLYFLIKFSKEGAALEHRLKAALTLLGEDGMGGERSSGAGRFQILSWQALPPQWKKVVDFNAEHHSLISLYWEPQISPLLLGEQACYQLQERGGWIASPFSGRQLRRQKIHMFTEGSVLTSAPTGRLANVTPAEFRTSQKDVYRPHPIYRSGVALSLAISQP